MAKKQRIQRMTVGGKSIQIPPGHVLLQRLDATGGTVLLTEDHARRLLALEARINAKNFSYAVADAPRPTADSGTL
jgi:hypothetical protein